MKTINTYINERLHVTTKSHLYSCQPTTKKELQEIIIQRIKDDGLECDLNDIDVSKINDMGHVFDAYINKIFKDFNGDVSQWNVSNVKNMEHMFWECKKFNCDLSKWDVSNVENIEYMFYGCENFKQNLNKWNVSKVKKMKCTFTNCTTKPKWYDKDNDNYSSDFFDISQWNVSNAIDGIKQHRDMFDETELSSLSDKIIRGMKKYNI